MTECDKGRQDPTNKNAVTGAKQPQCSLRADLLHNQTIAIWLYLDALFETSIVGNADDLVIDEFAFTLYLDVIVSWTWKNAVLDFVPGKYRIASPLEV
jgi:hypothetical protein